MAARAEVSAAIRDRYAASGRAAKKVILDEFVALTGLHRKHAIRLLGARSLEKRPRGRPERLYGAAVKAALALLWEASDRVCSKRLKPMIPVLLPALERHGQLAAGDELRAKLHAVSPATIDRLLSETRIAAAQGRRRRAGFSSAVRRSVPVRTFADWGDPPPGFLEVDFDNDGAFMNEPVVAWCRAQGLEVTRSRAYRKNDQAWVEQKNGAIVRRLVGYGRFEGPAATALLARLYAAARPHTKLFQPSFKLREKVRVGARVTKRWHPPLTPADRALTSGRLDAESMARILDLRSRADPAIALAAVRAVQTELGQRVDQRGIAPAPKDAAIIVDLVSSVAEARRNGEHRKIHRRPYRRVKPIPKRASMLDPHRADIEAWLEAQPALTGLEVLAGLKQRHPDRFTDSHLRTIQRMVKAWGALEARKIIRSATAAMVVSLGDATVAPEPRQTVALGNILG